MSLKRSMLSALGIESEKIEEIIKAHSETVSALNEQIDTAKAEAAKYKKDAEKLPGVQKELDDLKAKVEADAKESEGKDYDALKKEFDDYKAEQERKSVEEHKKKVVSEFLKANKISDEGISLFMDWHGVDSVELTEKGKIANVKDLQKEVDEGYLKKFTEKTTVFGADTTKPPASTGGSKMTIEQIDAINDVKQRQKAMLENPELFGL